jgi:hypothetical protein
MVCTFLVCTIAVAGSHAQVCPNITIANSVKCMTGGYIYHLAAKYTDNTVPAQSMSGHNLFVIWPHNGQGHLGYTTYTNPKEYIDVWYNETITSSLAFSGTPKALCKNQTATYSIADNCGTSFTWTLPPGSKISGGSNTLTTSAKSVSITAPSPSNQHGTSPLLQNLKSHQPGYLFRPSEISVCNVRWAA